MFLLTLLVICGVTWSAYAGSNCNQRRNRFGDYRCSYMRNLQRMTCNDAYMKVYCEKLCCMEGGGGVKTNPPRTYPPTYQPPRTLPPGGGSCGKSFYQNDKVISGHDARAGQFPWQILLKSNGRPGCGGSLISANWAITAAHCIRGRSGYTIVLGALDRNRPSREEQEISVTPDVHPQWNQRTFNYDVALLRLSRPARMNSNVNPICLPSRNAVEGEQCYISGWGKTSSFGQMHHHLQFAKMNVVSTNTCHMKNHKSIGVTVTEQMICGTRGVGESDKVSGCQGDSGGPLACTVNGRYELHGAVSHGSRNCESSKTYTVFGRIYTAMPWIKQKTGM